MSKEIMVAAVMAATPLDCLALNIYHEARGESKQGQIAVGHVTLNRVRSKKYPNSICEVVYQHKQFSWTHDKISNVPKDQRLYKRIRDLSSKILRGKYKDPTNGAIHFHAKKCRPYWVNKVKKTVTIGNHIFYKK